MATSPIPAGPIPSNVLARMFPDRLAIESAIEQLIGVLDAIDGDCDDEEDCEDCCDAYDDRPGHDLTGLVTEPLVGDEDDAEPEEGKVLPYGIDQTDVRRALALVGCGRGLW